MVLCQHLDVLFAVFVVAYLLTKDFDKNQVNGISPKPVVGQEVNLGLTPHRVQNTHRSIPKGYPSFALHNIAPARNHMVLLFHPVN